MHEFSDVVRERFWSDLIVQFDHRIRAYCRTTRCDPDDIDQIVWDLWYDAIELERSLAAADDQWPLLLNLLRPLCARRVAVLRREVPLNEGMIPPNDDSSLDDTRHNNLADLAMDLLWQLPEKQRIAVDFRYRWHMPFWAIAAGLDTAEATARVHAVRGIRRLRQLLSHGACLGDPEESAKQ